MRLIDGEELERLFNEQIEQGVGVIGAFDAFYDALQDTPTVDAVPVVRCKECKWFADNNDGDWFGCWLFQTIQIIPEDTPKPDDYCSYGERRDYD
nr:MAG TPA: hypothetical protein [Caudoviricetes sp.]